MDRHNLRTDNFPKEKLAKTQCFIVKKRDATPRWNWIRQFCSTRALSSFFSFPSQVTLQCRKLMMQKVSSVLPEIDQSVFLQADHTFRTPTLTLILLWSRSSTSHILCPQNSLQMRQTKAGQPAITEFVGNGCFCRTKNKVLKGLMIPALGFRKFWQLICDDLNLESVWVLVTDLYTWSFFCHKGKKTRQLTGN